MKINLLVRHLNIMMLQNFKLLQYVSAERLGPKNISARIDSLDNNWLGVKGEYVINVLSNQGALFQAKVCEVFIGNINRRYSRG